MKVGRYAGPQSVLQRERASPWSRSWSCSSSIALCFTSDSNWTNTQEPVSMLQPAHTHSYTHTHTHKTHTHMQTRRSTVSMLRPVHTHTHICIPTLTHMHPHTRTYIHTHAHTHRSTHAHIYTQTQKHKHTPSSSVMFQSGRGTDTHIREKGKTHTMFPAAGTFARLVCPPTSSSPPAAPLPPRGQNSTCSQRQSDGVVTVTMSPLTLMMLQRGGRGRGLVLKQE